MKLKNLLPLLLVAFGLMFFNSCKKETVDVTDLLKSVPSSASGVVVFNVEGLLSDTGCKINGHEVTPSKEIEQIISKASTVNQKDFLMIFDGSTGIEPKGAVVFYDTNKAFLTVALYDVEKFTNFIEQKSGATFASESNGVKICGNVAVKGAQAWLCLTPGKRLDPDAIDSYSKLQPSQSFLVSPLGENLLTDESDIRGWIMLNTYFSQNLDRSNRTMASLGLGMLFENGESMKFKVDFKKGELEMETVILNDQGKPAKFQLPMEKVDVATLKTLGTSCQGMMAFTLTPKLVKKFQEIGDTFGGALFGDINDFLKNVDGTVGVTASGNIDNEDINGVVTTKGDVSQELKGKISELFGSISMDGKLLRFSKGSVSGNLSVDECADALKGCYFGIVVDAEQFSQIGVGSFAQGFKSGEVLLKPEGQGIELEIEAKTINEKENALMTILRNI
ncbi:MAG: hypothetical protein J1D77_02850 [Muribaculaceae bacterium]|nr:hypothetical protein [Muribaculaceae bacterium]